MTVTAAINTVEITAPANPSISDKIRRGRLTALATLRARHAAARNVVSIFENTIETRVAEPVFHSRRATNAPRRSKLLLKNAFST